MITMLKIIHVFILLTPLNSLPIPWGILTPGPRGPDGYLGAPMKFYSDYEEKKKQ